MEEIYTENTQIIDKNLEKTSTMYKDLISYSNIQKSEITNNGNVAQFVNPNLPTRDIKISFLNNRNSDYKESINNIVLSLYDELRYIKILKDIKIISIEIKSNYKTNKNTTINAILIEEYNKLISQLKIFDNKSILSIYDAISNNIEKFNILKKFNDIELIFFNSLVKTIYINLNTLIEMENIMKNNYPNSKDTKTSIKRFIGKIEDIIRSNTLDTVTISKLNILLFRLNKKINANIYNEKLSNVYEMKNLLIKNDIKINKKKSQLAYNNIIKKFKSKEDGYQLSFIKLEKLSNLFH